MYRGNDTFSRILEDIRVMHRPRKHRDAPLFLHSRRTRRLSLRPLCRRIPSYQKILDGSYTRPVSTIHCAVYVRFDPSGSATDPWRTSTRDVLHGDDDGITQEVPKGIPTAEGNMSLGYVRFGMARVARSNRPGSRGAGQCAHSLCIIIRDRSLSILLLQEHVEYGTHEKRVAMPSLPTLL